MTRFISAYSEQYDAALIETLSRRHNLPPLAVRALIRRGLTEDTAIERFLHPGEGTLTDPFLQFRDMEKAVRRIRMAALTDEMICVYGDYDADGITATAILYDALRDLTDNVIYYIPSRHDAGYGLHCEAIDELHAEGVTLLVTVDNGISAKNEIAYCAELGIDVIVTDHHQEQDGPPDCAAVLSAATECGKDALCGAGLAMKLALALLPEERAERFLPLASIATVADMVPLIGENRTIVTLGLPLITNNLGIRALMASGDQLKRTITEMTVAFFIAPRLNAAGRIGHASTAVDLLLSKSLEEALVFANALEEANTERRSQEAQIYADAVEQANGHFSVNDRALVLKKDGWNVGVVGIVASRLVETYHVPALVFSEHAGELTGSGRSIEGVNLFQALFALKHHFLRFGGHAMAAGVTLSLEEFESFQKEFLAYLDETYDASAFTPTYTYEERGFLPDFTAAGVKALGTLAPFGEGNREPIFLFEGVRLENVRTMGREKTHLCADASAFHVTLRTVGFSMGRYAQLLATGGSYDLLATASINSYLGVENPELYLKKLRRHPDGNEKIIDAFLNRILYNENEGLFEDLMVLARPYEAPFYGLHLDKERMQTLYRAFMGVLKGNEVFLRELSSLVSAEQVAALLVFVELGFIAFDKARGTVSLVTGAKSRPLAESKLFCWLQRLSDKK